MLLKKLSKNTHIPVPNIANVGNIANVANFANFANFGNMGLSYFFGYFFW